MSETDVPMTPEERFIKIEKSLNTVSEHLTHIAVRHDLMKAQHDADVREIHRIQKSLSLAIAKGQEQTGKALTRLADAGSLVHGRQKSGAIILGTTKSSRGLDRNETWEVLIFGSHTVKHPGPDRRPHELKASGG